MGQRIKKGPKYKFEMGQRIRKGPKNKFKMGQRISSNLFFLLYVLLNFPYSNFGSQYLYIISIMSPLEPERAAEARRAVVASSL